jgi:hypothetical protein
MRMRILTAALSCTIALAGCGGGGGEAAPSATTPPSSGGSQVPAPTRNAVGGIWEGTIPGLGVSVIGLVAENGEFHFIQSDEVQYFGTVSASGSTVSGSYVGVTPVGFAFLDGSLTGTGTLAGSVLGQGTMSLQSAFRTALGSQNATNFTLAYDRLYERASALGTIAGNYRDPGTSAVVNVNAAGVVFSQDATTGCVINGQISIIDGRFNAYRVEYTFSGCRGSESVLNGTTARGLAALDNTVSPESAIIGVVNAAARYSYTGVFPRT